MSTFARVTFVVLFAFILGACASELNAQEAIKRSKGEFIGLMRGGIVGSHIYNDDFGGYNKLGGVGGFGVNSNILRSGNLQFEILYAMRGSRRPADPEKGIIPMRLGAHYIDLPLLYSNQISRFKYEVGLVNSVLVFSNITVNGVEVPLVNGMGFNRYELGGLLGVSLSINDKWDANVRFQHSITPAMGSFFLVNGFSITGGAFNNAVSFCLVRMFRPN